MATIRFPDPQFATPEGIVALGGTLTPENLMSAYRQGIFPWPIEGLPLPWFCPPRRAILRFSELHIPRSLALARKRSILSFSIDRAFRDVITTCAKIRRTSETGTWITPDMISAYSRLHYLGFAHSIEAWEGNNLIGGLYGVDAGGVFVGESMFHLRPNASKLALLFLFDYLRKRGSEWMDIQMMSPHMLALGAVEVSRSRFLKMLSAAQGSSIKLF
jgi:leucyl/phenylalanyl-tRNA--protein transferase